MAIFGALYGHLLFNDIESALLKALHSLTFGKRWQQVKVCYSDVFVIQMLVIQLPTILRFDHIQNFNELPCDVTPYIMVAVVGAGTCVAVCGQGDGLTVAPGFHWDVGIILGLVWYWSVRQRDELEKQNIINGLMVYLGPHIFTVVNFKQRPTTLT